MDWGRAQESRLCYTSGLFAAHHPRGPRVGEIPGNSDDVRNTPVAMIFSLTPTLGYICTSCCHHGLSSPLPEIQMGPSRPQTLSQLNVHSYTMTKLPEYRGNHNFQGESALTNIKAGGGRGEGENEMSS